MLPDKPLSLAAAILTMTTCGEPCWAAREDICRCSCGGRNHGCLRSADGVRPARTSKIDGRVYELSAVGNHRDLYSLAQTYNREGGPVRVERIPAREGEIVYEYYYHETDCGAPARLKCASKAQRAKWPELAAYRELPPYQSVYCLWRKVKSGEPKSSTAVL